MEELKIVYLPPGELTPYAANAKKHPDDQVQHIANSIKEFGFRQPIVVDADNVVVIGHGRLLAAKKLGLDAVPVVRADDLTEAQIKALRLADNKTNESEWDFLSLEAELAELELDFDMSDFGFEDIEAVTETGTATEDDYDVDAPVEARAKLGDIYQLGRHRLMCGDSTDADAWALLMDGERADISITSPPYGESNSAKLRDHYERGKKKRASLYKTHDDNINDWLDLMNGAFANMQAYSTGQFLNVQMLADNKIDLITWLDAHKETLVDVIIWDKMKAAPQMQDNILNNQFEFVFVFCNDNNTRTIPFANFHGNTNNVIQLSTGHNEFADVHRAVYPVEFPAKILGIASKAESVIDPFGGTGTTIIAAEQLNRRCFMMELDPHYVDVIISRWETFTGQKAVLLNG